MSPTTGLRGRYSHSCWRKATRYMSNLLFFWTLKEIWIRNTFDLYDLGSLLLFQLGQQSPKPASFCLRARQCLWIISNSRGKESEFSMRMASASFHMIMVLIRTIWNGDDIWASFRSACIFIRRSFWFVFPKFRSKRRHKEKTHGLKWSSYITLKFNLCKC